MAKMYIMGNYTEKAFQGFLKDPNSDRKAVVEKLVQGVGGKLHTMDIVRCKVKSSSREEYLKKIDEMPKFYGQTSAKYV